MENVIGLKFKDHSSLNKDSKTVKNVQLKKKNKLSPFCLLLHFSVIQSTCFHLFLFIPHTFYILVLYTLL